MGRTRNIVYTKKILIEQTKLTSLGSADHCQCNTRITRSRFNNGLTGLQGPIFLRIFDQRKGEAVL